MRKNWNGENNELFKDICTTSKFVTRGSIMAITVGIKWLKRIDTDSLAVIKT